MSSLKWLKPTKEQAEWLKPYLAKRYPDIDIKLSRLAFNTEEYCKNFKKRVDDFWGDKYERKVKIDRMRNNWDKKNSRKKAKNGNLTISLPPEIKQQFLNLKKFPRLENHTQAQLLEELLTHYTDFFKQDKVIRTVTSRDDERHNFSIFESKIKDLEEELCLKNKELETLKAEHKSTTKMNYNALSMREKPNNESLTDEQKMTVAEAFAKAR